MNIEQKKILVSKLREDIAESKVVITAHYAGLTVMKMTEFRTSAKKSEVKVRVRG